MGTSNALQEIAGFSKGRKASVNAPATNDVLEVLAQAFQTGAKDCALLLSFHNDGKSVEAEDTSGSAAATKVEHDAEEIKQPMTEAWIDPAASGPSRCGQEVFQQPFSDHLSERCCQ